MSLELVEVSHFFCNFARMKVYLNNNLHEVTPAQLEYDMATLPQWRRDVALGYKSHASRVLSVEVYKLLHQALAEVWGIDGSKVKFEIGAHGKPTLVGHHEVHFNLSHCNGAVLCVVDTHPVGCDIEVVREQLNMELCNKCMNASEVEQIINSSSPTAEFTKLWTMKEAVVKLTGAGLTTPLHTILNRPDIVIETHGLAQHVYSIAQYAPRT